MTDLLRSAFCCSLFLLFVLSLGEIQLRRGAAMGVREELRWGSRIAELYCENLQRFVETCKLANVSAGLEENERLLWQFGPQLEHSVRFPVCFANRPAELVIWTG
jgi:hypothetical protein